MHLNQNMHMHRSETFPLHQRHPIAAATSAVGLILPGERRKQRHKPRQRQQKNGDIRQFAENEPLASPSAGRHLAVGGAGAPLNTKHDHIKIAFASATRFRRVRAPKTKGYTVSPLHSNGWPSAGQWMQLKKSTHTHTHAHSRTSPARVSLRGTAGN